MCEKYVSNTVFAPENNEFNHILICGPSLMLQDDESHLYHRNITSRDDCTNNSVDNLKNDMTLMHARPHRTTFTGMCQDPSPRAVSF